MKQYIRSDGARRETTRNLATQVPTTSAAPKVVINYIHRGLVDKKIQFQAKKAKTIPSSLRKRTGQLHLAQLAKWGCMPSGWDNHLPSNKPQSGTTATRRRPDLNIGDK